MGLDMSLTGEAYFIGNRPVIKGFEDMLVTAVHFEIGYWRKHPNLHGFIVETFDNGIDECQDIRLNLEDIIKIIEAVTEGSLPYTEGFFFGSSEPWEQGEGLKETLEILKKAKEFLSGKDFRSIIYRASW